VTIEYASVSELFLDSCCPFLVELKLAANRLESVSVNSLSSTAHALQHMDLSSNAITRMYATANTFSSLRHLNISGNQLTAVDSSWFTAFPQLVALGIDDNPIRRIDGGAFAEATSLRELSLCRLDELRSLDDDSFRGLLSLEKLNVSGSARLSQISGGAFDDLRRLKVLDLRHNQLQTISYRAFVGLEELTVGLLSGNRWHCDCRMKLLRDALMLDEREIGSDIVCSSPTTMRDVPLFDADFNRSACGETSDRVRHYGGELTLSSVQLGNDVVLDCDLALRDAHTLTWAFGDGRTLEGRAEVERTA
jgi:hypothetical protein